LLKKLFGKKDASDEAQYTIDDLIVLERYPEAEQRIHQELKFRGNDLNLHLKLADVYVGQRNVQKAVDEYVWVAEKYAADGFHERGVAVLTKARRLNPMDDTLPARIERFEAARKLEHNRPFAQDGFLTGMHAKEAASGTGVMEFQAIWRNLGKSRILRELNGDQLKLFFQGVTAVYLNPGQTLVERGSNEEALYLIVSGELNASVVDNAGANVDLRSFASGQVIGESTLFERKPWPASYKSKSKATLLKLTQPGLQICLTGNPDPRGFLDVLRREQNDREVGQAIARLGIAG
jgi:hypothetical protein